MDSSAVFSRYFTGHWGHGCNIVLVGDMGGTSLCLIAVINKMVASSHRLTDRQTCALGSRGLAGALRSYCTVSFLAFRKTNVLN